MGFGQGAVEGVGLKIEVLLIAGCDATYAKAKPILSSAITRNLL